MKWTRVALIAVLTLALPPADVSGNPATTRTHSIAGGGGVHPNPDRPKHGAGGGVHPNPDRPKHGRQISSHLPAANGKSGLSNP